MKKFLLAVLSICLPVVASAATLGSIINGLKSNLSGAIGLFLSLGLVAFFYGMVKYLFSLGAGKAEGKSIMWWGVIALFVMVSVWGLTTMIADTLGITSGGGPTAPSGF